MRERLSDKNFAKMWNAIVDEDPTAQILSAYIAKEELRTLPSTVKSGGDRHLTRHRLHRFLAWCIDSNIPELLTLAKTIDTWWPEINAFVSTGITNARPEGYNRLVKAVKRAGLRLPKIVRTRPAGYASTAPANSGPRLRLHADRPEKLKSRFACCHCRFRTADSRSRSFAIGSTRLARPHPEAFLLGTRRRRSCAARV